jgi:hypothetical protein
MLGGAAEVIVTLNACHWSHSTTGANLSAARECVRGDRVNVSNGLSAIDYQNSAAQGFKCSYPGIEQAFLP